MKDIKERCEAYYEEIVAIRRTIHSHPELGMECGKTTDLICSCLDRIGIPYRRTGESGVIADLKGTKAEADAMVLLRSDMDALAMNEATGLPFASEIPGRMHACGHDLHTAIMLGSASILKEMQGEFAGTVRFLFQPAEELSDGARYMIEQGALDGVNICYGLHMDPFAPTGTIRMKAGPDWAAVDRFTITVHGTSAHGAMPHKGADATVAASALVLDLQSMVSRYCDPMSSLVVTIGSLHSGTAWNIISNEAVLEGTCRSFDREIYERIPELLERVVTHTPQSYGCTGELDLRRTCPPVMNDETIYALAKQSASKILGEEQVLEAVQEMIG